MPVNSGEKKNEKDEPAGHERKDIALDLHHIVYINTCIVNRVIIITP